MWLSVYSLFFFFNDTATPEIYPLPLHDALPISEFEAANPGVKVKPVYTGTYQDTITKILTAAKSGEPPQLAVDRKSTRLNSSHSQISYAVFCLKKKKSQPAHYTHRDASHPGLSH